MMSNIKYHVNSSSKSFQPTMNQSDKINTDAPNKTIEIVHPTQRTDHLTLGGAMFFSSSEPLIFLQI